MKQDISNKIQQLIDGLLPEDKKNDLIAKIKDSKELKMEFALLTRIKKEAQSKLRGKLKERANVTMSETPASYYLQQFEAAAFSKTGIVSDEDLPIDDDTIQDFLEDDSEE